MIFLRVERGVSGQDLAGQRGNWDWKEIRPKLGGPRLKTLSPDELLARLERQKARRRIRDRKRYERIGPEKMRADWRARKARQVARAIAAKLLSGSPEQQEQGPGRGPEDPALSGTLAVPLSACP